MPLQVVTGALLKCSFGLAPAPLTVLPTGRVMAGGVPAANILDHKPVLNIAPFALCQSLANPTVAAATAAALGVLTPMPCVPATAAPWVPLAPKSIVGGAPALVTGSQCVCTFGGVIQILSPGQVTVQTS